MLRFNSVDPVTSNSDLYFEILRVGIENLSGGLTLEELKQKLTEEQEVLDSFVNNVFLNNFSPMDPKVVVPLGVLKSWKESTELADKNKDKKFIVNPSSVAEYVKLQHSKTNLKAAKISRCISLVALLASLGIFGIACYNLSHTRPNVDPPTNASPTSSEQNELHNGLSTQ